MRRRRSATLGAFALATGSLLVSACDTNDGRDMQEPDPYQVFQLENTDPTTTSTTSTIAPAVVPSAAPPSTTTSTTSSSSTSTIDDTAADTPDESAASSVGADGSAGVAASSVSTAISTSGLETSVASGVADAEQPADTFAESLGLTDLAAADVDFTGPWAAGDAIDIEYTCDDADQAPLVTWTAPPDGTVEMALAVTDESSDPAGFVHWIVVGLPPEAGSAGGAEPLLVGNEAMNSFGNLGWQGPCPPDPQPHTYRFALYALSQAIELPAESIAEDIIAAVQASASGATSFTGTYQRA